VDFAWIDSSEWVDTSIEIRIRIPAIFETSYRAYHGPKYISYIGE